MKIDLIFLVVIGICIIFYFCSSTNTEHFNASNDVVAAVNKVYQADVGAIRTLADAAAKLQANTFTIPGVVTTNNINVSPGQWGTGHVGDGTSYIVNDNLHYKKLMLVGNNTAGGVREVGIWDNLNVAGNISASSISAQDNINVNNNTNEGGRLRILNGLKKNAGQTKDWSIWNMTGSHYGNKLSFWRYNGDGHSPGSLLDLFDSGTVGVNGTLAIPGYGDVKATLDNILSRLAAIEASYVKKDVRFRLQNTNVWEQGNSTFLNVVMSDGCYLGVRGNSCGRTNWGSSRWGGDDADFRIQQ
jgi:hypothetical protein